MPLVKTFPIDSDLPIGILDKIIMTFNFNFLKK